MDKGKYTYLPHPNSGYERRVFRPNSARTVDACAELNRLRQIIEELEAERDEHMMYAGGMQARAVTLMQALASEARKGRKEWAQLWLKRADEAALEVKREDFVRVHTNSGKEVVPAGSTLRVATYNDMVDIRNDWFYYSNIRNMYKTRHGQGLQVDQCLADRYDEIQKLCGVIAESIYKLRDIISSEGE